MLLHTSNLKTESIRTGYEATKQLRSKKASGFTFKGICSANTRDSWIKREYLCMNDSNIWGSPKYFAPKDSNHGETEPHFGIDNFMIFVGPRHLASRPRGFKSRVTV